MSSSTTDKIKQRKTLSTSEKLERLRDKLAQCEDEFDDIVNNIPVMNSDGVRDAANEMSELADKMQRLEEKIERLEYNR